MKDCSSRSHRWPLTALALVVSACAAAHQHPHPIGVRIPFHLTPADNIAVRATLNGTDAVELMLHTAVDSVSLTKAAIARMSSFAATDTISVRSWGGTAQARHSTGNSLQIGTFTWQDISVTESDNSGTGTDGKFGLHLFAGKVVEIDFDSSELVIHQALPPMNAGYQRLDLLGEPGNFSVIGEFTLDGRKYTTAFLLHTGFGGTALLDEEFLRTNGLDASLDTLSESVLKDSYGNEVKTRKVRLPALRFGNTTFHDVAIGTFDGKIGSERKSILGGGLLKRCNLIIDAQNRALYVRPSKLADAAIASLASPSPGD